MPRDRNYPNLYLTEGLVRSENEARILYTVEKFILQSKGAHFEKIRRRTKRGEITFHSVSRGTAWPLHFKFASYDCVLTQFGSVAYLN